MVIPEEEARLERAPENVQVMKLPYVLSRGRLRDGAQLSNVIDPKYLRSVHSAKCKRCLDDDASVNNTIIMQCFLYLLYY